MDIQHIQGDLNNDLYAVPMKNNSHECTDELPAGWEKHEGACTVSMRLYFFSLNKL